MVDAKFLISWDAQKRFLSGLIDLQQKGDYVDMTLAADGHFVKVHQVVLALSSSYLGELIKTAHTKNNAHPILFLHSLSYKTLSYLLEYMYTGEVCISIEHLQEFVEAGKKLLIGGIDKLENPLITVQKSTAAKNDNTEEYHILQVGNPNEDVPEDVPNDVPQDDHFNVNIEYVNCDKIIPDKVELNMPEDLKASDPVRPDTNVAPRQKLIKILPKPTLLHSKKNTTAVTEEKLKHEERQEPIFMLVTKILEIRGISTQSYVSRSQNSEENKFWDSLQEHRKSASKVKLNSET